MKFHSHPRKTNYSLNIIKLTKFKLSKRSILQRNKLRKYGKESSKTFLNLSLSSSHEVKLCIEVGSLVYMNLNISSSLIKVQVYPRLCIFIFNVFLYACPESRSTWSSSILIITPRNLTLDHFQLHILSFTS